MKGEISNEAKSEKTKNKPFNRILQREGRLRIHNPKEEA